MLRSDLLQALWNKASGSRALFVVCTEDAGPFVQCAADTPQESYVPEDDPSKEEGVMSVFTSLEGAEVYMVGLIEDYEMRPSQLKVMMMPLKGLWNLLADIEDVQLAGTPPTTFRIDLVEQVEDRMITYDVIYSRVAPVH